MQPARRVLGLAPLGLAALATAAGAQVDVESMRPGTPPAGWSGSADYRIELKEGNTERLVAGGEVRLQYAVLEPGGGAEGSGTGGDAGAAGAGGAEPAAGDGGTDRGREEGAVAAGGDGGAAGATAGGDAAEGGAAGAKVDLARWLVFWVGQAEVAEQDGLRSENQAFGHLRGVRTVAPRIQVEGFVQYESNEFTRLDRRAVVGGGGRFALVAREHREVFFGTGLMFEAERLEPLEDGDPSEGTEARRLETVRSTSYLTAKVRWPPRDHVFATTVYLQPRLDRPSDVRLLLESSLEVPLGKGLALGLELTVHVDNEPPAGVEERDLALTHYLRYTF